MESLACVNFSGVWHLGQNSEEGGGRLVLLVVRRRRTIWGGFNRDTRGNHMWIYATIQGGAHSIPS